MVRRPLWLNLGILEFVFGCGFCLLGHNFLLRNKRLAHHISTLSYPLRGTELYLYSYLYSCT